jgi:NTE family protein
MVNSEGPAERRRERADLLLTPPLEHVGMLDWKDWQRAIESGYRHTCEMLSKG